MLVRNRADLRSLLWIGISTALVAVQYARPDWLWLLSPVSCYFAVAAGTITHNHNHYATFKNRRLNNAFGNLLTLFWGYPTLMWIPTHNLNHHQHLNRTGDATITWRVSNKHNFSLAASYWFISSYYQSPLIKDYISNARLRNPRLFHRIVFQYAFWAGSAVGMLALAVALHGWLLGLAVWSFSLVIPAICSLATVMFFNYTQHVHTDAWSEHDHSRNFTGPIFNFLFFNNGYHTAHHENQNVHWSRLPEEHRRLEHLIDPRLNQRNLAVYLFRQFILAPLLPRFGTRQLGGAPADTPANSQALAICGVHPEKSHIAETVAPEELVAGELAAASDAAILHTVAAVRPERIGDAVRESKVA